jgi:putative glycosyltransferase (TIGR04372 family)
MKTIYKLVTLLLKLLSYFLVIKIGELETRSVGHYSKSIDIFLSEKKIFPSKKVTLEIWFTNNFVANHFLLNKWSEKLFILPNNKIINQLFFGFYIFLLKNSLKTFLVNYRDHRNTVNWQIRDIHKVLKNSKQNFKFTEKEIQEGEELLQKIIPNYNDKTKLISIHCRDDAYVAGIRGTTVDYGNNFRRVNIKNFIKGIASANKEDYFVLKVGNYSSEETILDTKQYSFIDYSFSKYKSDFLDLYLAYRSSLYLGSDSGVVYFPGLFRKPMMMHNICNVSVLNDFNDSTCALVNFKKIYSKKLKRLITFSENISLNVASFKDEDFISNQLEVIETDEDEIEEFVKECIWIDNKKNEKYFNCELQAKTRNLMISLGLSNMGNIKVSPAFLNKYKELIK